MLTDSLLLDHGHDRALGVDASHRNPPTPVDSAAREPRNRLPTGADVADSERVTLTHLPDRDAPERLATGRDLLDLEWRTAVEFLLR